MRIKELKIRDWQVVRHADFQDLSDFVVVAGPNGVGKTKIKEAIVHIFRNGGNPPQGSKVVLEATSDEEISVWQKNEVELPVGTFWSIFGSSTKRLKTKSRLIQIDSNRGVESINFNQLTFQSIGDPENEEVGLEYGLQSSKNRFQDICHTLHRLKSKEVTSVYQEYQANLDPNNQRVVLDKLQDSTAKYSDLFNQLLYPKKMLPIDINSSTIKYLDEDENERFFNELSSGEREVIVLTFDILSQNPYDCLILIDEPEVHLHPELTFRLIKVLKSIGERNQFFIFTHSADIIGNSLETGVHFLRPKSKVTGNQVMRVDENNIDFLHNLPNLRETIGLISVGKKLLFVEGKNTSIDRNVFATIAKASKMDIAIIPSESCSNINNISIMCETLEKGLFGVEIFMIRDRDGLMEEQISNYTSKSKGRLIFLPFYHIENAFLNPQAIAVIAKKILLNKAPTTIEIEQKMIELARMQLMHTVSIYVKSEFYFQAGNFDITPKVTFSQTTTIEELKSAMEERKNNILSGYSDNFSESKIDERLNHWKKTLEDSIATEWSENARKYFIGKRILKDLQQWLFGRDIILWEHIINSRDEACIEACRELRDILNRV